jgi:hypothetical protein
MAFSDKLTVVIDFVTGPAQSGVKKLRTEVAQAEGAMGKMKAATVGVGGALNQYAGQAALAAGTALVAFGVKSVQAFQDTALAARDFSNATQVSVEEASRLAEVAGDFGIEASAVEGAIMKMNKALGDGKPVFEQYGVEIAKTDSGLVDANATFINAITTIGAIQDPTKRAQAAQQAFGKSYGEVARFMEMSADELREALAGVSDQQAISDEEAQRAEEFALALDNLEDSLKAVSMQVGGDLVPMLTSLAEALSFVQSIKPDEDSFLGKLTDRVLGAINPMQALKNITEEVSDLFGDSGETATEAAEASAELAAAAAAAGISLEDAGGRAEYYGSRVAGAKIETARAERAIKDMDTALLTLQGRLDDRAAWRSLKESLDELQAKIADGETSWMELGEATDGVVSDTARYIETLDGVDTEVKTQLYTMLDEGALNEVLLIIDDLKKQQIKVPVTFTSTGMGSGQIGGMPPYPGGRDGNPRTPYPMAEGGVVMPRPGGTPAILGEAGRPEAVIPLDRAGNMLNGSAITVNIYPRALPTDRELIDLVNSVRRRNGNVI